MPLTASISVVIPTRNRPDSLRQCLDSLAAVAYLRWDGVVIDQGDDERAEHVVRQYSDSLPQITYRHMVKKGQALACNEGIQATQGDIVAFLHDDCTVQPDWLEQIANAFGRHPEAALVFGTAVSAPHDPDEFFIPVYPVKTEHVIRGRRAFVRPDGMGATMYICRAALQRVGLLDPYLGVGSQFSFGGEDNDYIYRCLLAGLSVVRTPAIVVEHYGTRSHKNGDVARLLRGYAYSAGILDMKVLRGGHGIALLLMASHCAYFLLEMVRHGPSNIDRLGMYARGLIGSFQLGVDRRHGLYAKRRVKTQVTVPITIS